MCIYVERERERERDDIVITDGLDGILMRLCRESMGSLLKGQALETEF